MSTSKFQPTPEQDDQLNRTMNGDRAALVELLEGLGPIVRARIVPKISPHLRSSIDEDDVMQVTYLEAVTRIETFRHGGVTGFLAWLTRLAENNLIDAVRMLESAKRPNPKKRVVGRVTDESVADFVEVVGVTYSTPSMAVARDEAVGALDRTLSRLPKDYAAVIRMYDLEGLGAAEVAERMGKSEGAIYMMRARAHERLRDLLPSESKLFSKRG